MPAGSFRLDVLGALRNRSCFDLEKFVSNLFSSSFRFFKRPLELLGTVFVQFVFFCPVGRPSVLCNVPSAPAGPSHRCNEIERAASSRANRGSLDAPDDCPCRHQHGRCQLSRGRRERQATECSASATSKEANNTADYCEIPWRTIRDVQRRRSWYSRAQPERIREVDRIAPSESVEIEASGQPDRVLLRALDPLEASSYFGALEVADAFFFSRLAFFSLVVVFAFSP